MLATVMYSLSFLSVAMAILPLLSFQALCSEILLSFHSTHTPLEFEFPFDHRPPINPNDLFQRSLVE